MRLLTASGDLSTIDRIRLLLLADDYSEALKLAMNALYGQWLIYLVV